MPALAVVVIVAYGIVTGVTYHLARRRVNDPPAAAFFAALWPVMIPALIVATHRLTAPKRAALPEARTRKDLP